MKCEHDLKRVEIDSWSCSLCGHSISFIRGRERAIDDVLKLIDEIRGTLPTGYKQKMLILEKKLKGMK